MALLQALATTRRRSLATSSLTATPDASTARSVGWIDRNENGQLDANEPRQVIDQTFDLALSRSSVFDYAYFVNNYGCMYGFSNEQLVMNGDARSNGDFEFRYGSGGPPVINGSIYASPNEKLSPRAAGRIILPGGNQAPRQWDAATTLRAN
jgi:hypothetical protein